MNHIEELIYTFDNNYKYFDDKYFFNYKGNNIFYDTREKGFYFEKDLFGKIPHILANGKLCLYGNVDIQLKELNEEIMIENTLGVYIPWLFNIPPEIKNIEFINEIEYYINKIFNKKVRRFKRVEPIYKTIQVITPVDLWETIHTLKFNKIYEIYPNKYPEYKIYIKRTKNEYIINYDLYNKSRLRVLGVGKKDIKGKICFIGVGSVNSYIIKQCLARNIEELVLIDNDIFKMDNAFRFAFPYKNKSKIDCVKEFSKILNNPAVITGYNVKINSDSSKRYISGCDTIFVSVDNFYSWIDVFIYLKNNISDEIKIIFAGVDAFGGYGKYIITDGKRIEENFKKFLFFNDEEGRRYMVGNGCGKSLAVYDEEDLNKLAKHVILDINEIGKVKKVEF